MRFSNLRLAWKASADLASGVKLGLATAATSHPKCRGVLSRVLAALSHGEGLWVSFRYQTRPLRACIRAQELEADLQGFREVVLHDCYGAARLECPEVVIDGGANVGFFTLIASAMWQDARVIAVEPIQENAEMIARHAEANGVRPIVVRACLGGKSGTTTFYRRMANRGSMFEQDPYSQTQDVQVTTLSGLRREAGPGRCLVKLDVEGAEVEVLTEFLSGPQAACTIVGELHGWPQHQEKFEAVLARANYSVEYHGRDRACVLFVAKSPDQAQTTRVPGDHSESARGEPGASQRET